MPLYIDAATKERLQERPDPSPPLDSPPGFTGTPYGDDTGYVPPDIGPIAPPPTFEQGGGAIPGYRPSVRPGQGGFTVGDVLNPVGDFVKNVADLTAQPIGRAISTGRALIERGFGVREGRDIGDAYSDRYGVGETFNEAVTPVYRGENPVLQAVTRPANLAALAFPSASFAPKAGLLARYGLETLADVVGTQTAEKVGEVLPEDTDPLLRGVLQTGAGIVAGGGAGIAGGRYVNAARAGKRLPAGMSIDDVSPGGGAVDDPVVRGTEPLNIKGASVSEMMVALRRADPANFARLADDLASADVNVQVGARNRLEALFPGQGVSAAPLANLRSMAVEASAGADSGLTSTASAAFPEHVPQRITETPPPRPGLTPLADEASARPPGDLPEVPGGGGRPPAPPSSGSTGGDPLLEAKREYLEAARREANIHRVGTQGREIHKTRQRQYGGIGDAAETLAREGASVDEAVARVGRGMYTGGRYSGRQTYAAPVHISDEAQSALISDLSEQMIRGDLGRWDYQNTIRALQRLQDGVGLEKAQVPLIRRVLGDEVAEIVARRPKGLEQEVLSGAKIAEERARLDAIGRTTARDALRSETRQSVKDVESRLRQLGADTDLPIPPRPSDETLRLAGMDASRTAGGMKARILSAQKITGAYEDAVAAAAKRDHRELLKSNKIIEDGIDFEARQAAQQARQAAAQYEAVVKRQAQIRSARVAESADIVEEGIGAEARALRQSIGQGQAEAIRLESGAARATRHRARDEMIDAFNRADSAAIQSLRADAERLAAQETARASRFRTPGVLAGAVSNVRQADELLERLTQKFPDPETLVKRAEGIFLRANQGMPRAEQTATAARVREMVRIWDDGNRAILDMMGDEAPQFVRAVSSQITGNVADSWLTSALQRRALLTNALRSEVDPRTARKMADALWNREMIQHYRVADPSKLPEHVQELIRQTKSLPYEDSLGAVETFAQRGKNTQFGLADFAVFGVNGGAAIRRGGIPAFAGYVNRGLTALHLPHIDTLTDNPVIGRRIMAALDGVHQGSAYGATVPDKGSLLQYGGRIGRAIDDPINRLVEKSTALQFGKILGDLRDATYEGELIAYKLLGRDISNPLVRSDAAAAANHLTGYANTALKRGRGSVEGIALISSPMARSRVAQIADMAKLITPKARPQQRISAALSILSTVGYTLAVGKLLNDQIGITDFIFDPSIPGFGTITTKDGRTHDMIPQDSVERAFAKSIRALAEIDEDTFADVGKAWGNVLLGSASVVSRAPAAGLGAGYQPGRGWRYGDWGEGMTAAQRAAALLPIPPIATDLAVQGFDKVGTAETILGIGNYPASPRTMVEAGQFASMPPEQQFKAIPAQAWKRMGEKPEFKTVSDKGFASFYDWRRDWIERATEKWTPKYGVSEAKRLAEIEVEKTPAAQFFHDYSNMLEDWWTKKHPELRQEAYDAEMAKPEGERRNLPRKPERAILQGAR